MYHLDLRHGHDRWGSGEAADLARDRADHRLLVSKPCGYCDVEIPAGSKAVQRRVSHGFGLANKEMLAFCDRRCRGHWADRGRKWADRSEHPSGNRRLDDVETEPETSIETEAVRAKVA